MSDLSSIAVPDLLPHGSRMILIDRLVSHDERRTVALAEVSARSVFFEGTGIPAWVGIEYMAQTIAARAGLAARLRGEPPAIGFVLGTRAYRSTLPEFPNGSTLTISAEPLLDEGSFSAFDCRIEMGRVVASAVVNVYRPGAEQIASIRSETAEP